MPKPLGQFCGAWIVKAQHRDMSDLVQLFTERSIEIRIGMPVNVGPDGGIAIEKAAAGFIFQPTACAANDVQAFVLRVLSHRRVRMPRVGEIALVGARSHIVKRIWKLLNNMSARLVFLSGRINEQARFALRGLFGNLSREHTKQKRSKRLDISNVFY